VHPRDLGLGQRIVVIVALAGVFRLIGEQIVARVVDNSGWFGYAPLIALPSSEPSWAPTVVGVVLVVVWAAVSIWLLGLPYGGGNKPDGNRAD
jgi:hypothetical protein